MDSTDDHSGVTSAEEQNLEKKVDLTTNNRKTFYGTCSTPAPIQQIPATGHK